jgi:phosphatidate cytidylyltransferase
LTRIISSIVSLPILLAIIYFGTPFHFFLLLEFAIFIGLYEFYRMIEKGGLGCYKWLGIVIGLLLSFAIFRGAYTNLAIAASIIILFIIRIIEGNNPPTPPFNKGGQGGFSYVSNTIFGILYVSLLMSYMALIRNSGDNGRELIFFILLVTWMGDTTAYYGGMSLGKHKLAPAISPKKTIEGAIIGLLGSIIGAVIAKFWFLDISVLNAVAAGILVGVFGQFGDLSESLIKRNLQVKDSGGIIPGHGGMLDRVDSLLFSAPVFYYYYIYIVNY